MSLIFSWNHVKKFNVHQEIPLSENMSWFEAIHLSIVILMTFLHLSCISCSNFELVSMTASSSITILPGEVRDTVSAGHWAECASKCRAFEPLSSCNTIQFDPATKNCFLAYKDVTQNICSGISKRSLDTIDNRRKRSEFFSFPSQVFILKSLLPTGELKKN